MIRYKVMIANDWVCSVRMSYCTVHRFKVLVHNLRLYGRLGFVGLESWEITLVPLPDSEKI